MSRPPKPVAVLKSEGRSHRTKSELAVRQAAEEANLTGIKLQEEKQTKNDPDAHRQWLRITKRMRLIGHDDDLYGPIINRYCRILSEEKSFLIMRDGIGQDILDLQNQREAYFQGDDAKTYFKQLLSLQNNMISLDRQIQTKRKMLLDIEKESILTVASSLRSIPKTPEAAADPLAAALAELEDDSS